MALISISLWEWMDEWPRATLLSTLKYSTFSIYSTLYIPRWCCFPLNLVSMSYFCCDKTCNYLHDTHITPHPPPIHPVQSHWHLPLPAPALVNDSLVLHLILLIYLSTHRFPQPTLFFPGFHFPAFATSFYPMQSDPFYIVLLSFLEWICFSFCPSHKRTIRDTQEHSEWNRSEKQQPTRSAL